MKKTTKAGAGARRSVLGRGRRRSAPLALEALEPKVLPANIIVVTNDPGAFPGYTAVSSMTSPSGWATSGDSGDYTVSPTVLEDATSAIQMYAHNSILIEATVTGLSQSLSATSYGYINVDADVSSNPGIGIDLEGNNQETEGSVDYSGVTVDDATIASGGNLTVDGDGYSYESEAGAIGVDLDDATLHTAGNILDVTGGVAIGDNGDNVGVLVGGGSSILADSGNLTVGGTSAGYADDQGHDVGVFVDGGTIATQTGTVRVGGTGGRGRGGSDDYGVLVFASGFIADDTDPDNSLGTGGTSTSAVITSASGDVTVQGIGGGGPSVDGNAGVMVDTGGRIGAGDSGDVMVTGTGGGDPETFGNDGVIVANNDDGPSALITSGGGDVTVSGYAGSGSSASGYSVGVDVGAGGMITSGGTGAVTISGQAAEDTNTGQIGILVGGLGATVTSTGGDVSLNGAGSNSDGGGLGDDGIRVAPLGTVTAGGMGTVSLSGTAGVGPGGADVGVDVDGEGSRATVTSSGGDITIVGTGGGDSGPSSAGNIGILVQGGGRVTGVGFAAVSLTGQSGNTEGGFDSGVLVDDEIEGAGTQVVTQGGTLTITGTSEVSDSSASRNAGVSIEYGAVVAATATGDVSVSGTGGYGNEYDAGVYLNMGHLGAGSGTLIVTGQGGGSDSGSKNDGVVIDASQVGTGEGAIAITGIGGTGATSDVGIWVTAAGTVTSTGGDIAVTGTGGGSSGSALDMGVRIDSGSYVGAKGSGTVTVTGTGGAGGGSAEFGVYLYGGSAGEIIKSVDGEITIAGTGGGASGSGGQDYGFYEKGSDIAATGAGGVLVKGTAGLGASWGLGVGFDPDNSGDLPLITTTTGGITIEGIGGGDGSDGHGIWANTLSLETTGGSVSVTGTGNAGSGDADGIHAPSLTISTTGSGEITLAGTGGSSSGAGTSSNGVYLGNGSNIGATGSGGITITGTGGASTGGNSNNGILVASSSSIHATTGPISLRGTGGDAGAGGHDNLGILIDGSSTIQTSVSGDVTLYGKAGSGDYDGTGVRISDGGTSVSAGGAGYLSITGIGDTSATSYRNYGVLVTDGATAASSSGDVTISGTGGAGTYDNDGVLVTEGSTIQSSGDVVVTGVCSPSTTGERNHGVAVEDGSTVQATGSGDLTINGTGGAGSYENVGVFAAYSGTIQVADGEIVVTGTASASATGSNNDGVEVRSGGAVQATGTGGVKVSGTGGGGSSDDDGVYVANGGTIQVVDGDIDVTGVGGGTDASAGAEDGVHVDHSGIVTATGMGDLSIAGTGGAGDDSSRGVYLSNSSMVTTAGGDLSITGTGGDAAGAANNEGVYLIFATVSVGGSGTLSLLGFGGDGGTDGEFNYGVGVAEMTLPAGGDITIAGTGGAGTTDDFGVSLNEATVAPGEDGDLSVTGTGGAGMPGSGPTSNNDGIFGHGTALTASGTGDISVTGKAGAAASYQDRSIGVYLDGGSIQTTGTGAVTVTGTGGASAGGNQDDGVEIEDEVWISSGGALALTGTGGDSGSGSGNRGIDVESATTIDARAAGDLTIIGSGGTGVSGDHGVYLYGATIEQTGTGDLSMTGTGGDGGDGIDLLNVSSVTTAAGDLTINGAAGADPADGGTNGVYESSSTIEPGGAGKLAITGVGGDGGATGVSEDGVHLSGGTVTTVTGDITISGTGGAGYSADDGVYLQGLMVSPGGNGSITVTGTGGDESSASQSPVHNSGIAAFSATIESSGTGDATISGQGGAAAGYQYYGDGLYLNNTLITTGGAGSVTVTGTGGVSVDGNKDEGIQLEDSSEINSGGGDVTVTGHGGDSGDGKSNYGILADNDSTIEATGTGNLAVTGTGGTGYFEDFGVALFGTTVFSAGTGSVTVTGTSGSGLLGETASEYNQGVFEDDGAAIESGDGDLTVEGIGGASAAGGVFDVGVWLNNGSIQSSGSGDVTVTADGGHGGGNAYGLYMTNAGAIAAYTGTVTVTGTGGGSLDGSGTNIGVDLTAGSQIASGDGQVVGGEVQVTGTGGIGGSGDVGIALNGGSVTSTSAETLTLIGIGGRATTGGSNDGIELHNDSFILEAGTGDLSLTGTGGTGLAGLDDGIDIDDGSIVATNQGDLSVTGTGGGTAGDDGDDIGVGVYGESLLSSGGPGTITVDGHGGLGGDSIGVDVNGSSEGASSEITSSGALVTIEGTGGGQAYDGGGDDGVRVANGGLIQGHGGGLDVTGTGGPGDGDNYGVRVTAGGVITSTGALSINGVGGGHAGDSGGDVGVGVTNGGGISPNGPLNIVGAGGPGGGHDYGIYVSEGVGGPTAISGHTMNLLGLGGGSDGSQGYDDGIRIDSGAEISSTGGTLTLNGTGGAFGIGQDVGIRVTDSGSQISSTGNGLSVTGTGGGEGNSIGDSGVALLAGGQVVWEGNAEEGILSVTGVGGQGQGGGNAGLLIDGTGSMIVLDSDLASTPVFQGGSGQAGPSPGVGIQITDGGAIEGEEEDASEDLDLDADTLLVDPTSTVSSPENTVSVALSGTGLISGVVFATSLDKSGAGTLNLQAEGSLQPGQIVVNQGTVAFAGSPPMLLPTVPVQVNEGSTLTLGAGSTVPSVHLADSTLDGSNPQGNAGDVTSEGDSTVLPGSTTAAGLLDVGSLGLVAGDTMVFKLGPQATAGQQPVPGVAYDQVRVVPSGDGSVIDIAGVTLDVQTLGAVAPEPGTVYTLISNPDGLPIQGTFEGLPEGASVLVGDVTFTLSYHGGPTGSDVVLADAADTTTTVTGPTSSPTYGQMATLIATVAGLGTSMIPTGTVVFKLEDGTVLGSSTLDASGVATISTPYLPAGTTTVLADFEGSTGFGASDGSLSQPVAQATPVIQLATATPTAVAGQALTLTGSVLPSAPGGLVPTGTATFYDATTGTTLAADVPLVDGRAVLTISDLAAGSHTIRFSYNSGDANYVGGGSATASVTITGGGDVESTSIALMAPATAYTQSVVTLTAIVDGGSDPAGTVEFFDGGSPIGTVALPATGVATLSVPDLSQGSHSFTAAFIAADGSVTSTTGAEATTVTTNPLAPVTVATSISVTPIYLPPPSTVPASLGGRNTRVRIAVQVVNPSAGEAAPTGSVTVLANGKAIGTLDLNSQGQATITLHGRVAYNRTIVVRYNGAIVGVTTYAPSSSSPFVADRAFFYGNSPQANRVARTRGKAHPAGPASAFRTAHPAAAARTSPATVLHALARSIARS